MIAATVFVEIEIQNIVSNKGLIYQLDLHNLLDEYWKHPVSLLLGFRLGFVRGHWRKQSNISPRERPLGRIYQAIRSYKVRHILVDIILAIKLVACLNAVSRRKIG